MRNRSKDKTGCADLADAVLAQHGHVLKTLARAHGADGILPKLLLVCHPGPKLVCLRIVWREANEATLEQRNGVVGRRLRGVSREERAFKRKYNQC